jgi:hypothetical protein
MKSPEFSKPTGEAATGEVLEFYEKNLRSGKMVRTAVDLDLTVVPYNRDPRACKVDPACHAALLRISKHQAPIVITGRDGWRAQQLVDTPNAVIVGTYGFEVRVGNYSYIYEKLAPWAETLTMGFQKFRELFLQKMGITLNDEIAREFEIPVPEGGRIVVERKAVGGIFLDQEGNPLPQRLTEGLGHVYNCNSVNPKGRIQIKATMEEAYNEVFNDLLQNGVPEAIRPEMIKKLKSEGESYDKELLKTYKNELQQLFCFKLPTNDPGQPGDWGMDLGPRFGNSKAHILLQLLRESADPKRDRYLSCISDTAEAIAYFGDSNPDAPGFRAIRLAQNLTEGKRQGISGWVMSPNSELQDKARRECSVAINGIEENGQVLTKIADLLSTTAF